MNRPSIYALTDAKTGEVRYIGKANNPAKRLKSHMRDSLRRDTPVYRWIRKNGIPGLVVLHADCDDWEAKEIEEIATYRAAGARLLNVAHGGDEPFCPPEVRAANGAANAKLRVSTPEKKRFYELRRNLGQALKQGYVAERTKVKMRAAAAKYPHLFSEWALI
jgi:hypothetical protein